MISQKIYEIINRYKTGTFKEAEECLSSLEELIGSSYNPNSIYLRDLYNFLYDRLHCKPERGTGRTKIVLGKDEKQFLPQKSRTTAPENRNCLRDENTSIEANTSVFNIITPSFNSVEFIDSTIMSVISQEGHFCVNYHIQDGGSTDGTVEKLEKWKVLIEQEDSPIVRCNSLKFSYSSELDNGMYDAISKGFNQLPFGNNHIMSWINSDDVYVGGAFASVDNILSDNVDVNWIINPVNICDKNQIELSFYNLYYPRKFIQFGTCEHKHWNFIQQEGSFWKGVLWEKVSGLNTSLKYCGDWDLWRRFALHSTPVHVEWPLGRFRSHKNQISSNMALYYNEIDSVVSESERSEILKLPLTKDDLTIKVVNRPLRKFTELKYETAILRESNIRKTGHPQNHQLANRVIGVGAEHGCM